MKIGRWVVLAIAIGTAGYFGWEWYRRGLAGSESPVSQERRMVPPGVRIKVEVLNATRIRGLARRATFHLRDRGFDVVDMATAPEQRSTTLVIDRSNHPEWAQLVASALGAKVESRPDSSRYLDVTVLLGEDWRPPPLPFYP